MHTLHITFGLLSRRLLISNLLILNLLILNLLTLHAVILLLPGMCHKSITQDCFVITAGQFNPRLCIKQVAGWLGQDCSCSLDKGLLQVLNRPSQQEAPHPLAGMGGMENGLVDLQMATEAFRDAFSATAPSLEGPVDIEQDYLLVEAYKSPANPITGVARLRACSRSLCFHTLATYTIFTHNCHTDVTNW